MGRQPKIVSGLNGEDRRELGYYSTPSFVADFLAKRLLELHPGARRVLDPCVGEGELVGPFAAKGLHVTGIDIVDRAPRNCSETVFDDFLEIAAVANKDNLFRTSMFQDSDIIIANPPYNCHETDYIRKNKVKLVEAFGKATALNMYSLFIRAIIETALPGSVIGLVTHDSFLTAIGHSDLRRYIFKECTIRDLHLCPTRLFASQGADVRTCLLILEKGVGEIRPVRVSNRAASVSEFIDRLKSENFLEVEMADLALSDPRDNGEIVIGVPHEIISMFSGKRLNEIAPCITGISTGNDKEYLRSHKQDGFEIEFYKNPASRRFFASPDAYITNSYEEVGKRVSNFMIRNKSLITKGGISCSSMGVKFGATIRPKGSLCGVNPNIIIDGADKWIMLAYLNSRLCLYILRGVINRSNMVTAGYAARIPVPTFDDAMQNKLAELGRLGFDAASNGEEDIHIKIEIDNVIERYLGLSSYVQNLLEKFDADPTRLT